MNITYHIELSDLYFFSDHLVKSSPVIHRAIRKGQLWWASGPLVGGLAFSIVTGASSEQTLVVLSMLSVAISLPMYFLYPEYFKLSNKKQIKKMHEKGAYNGIIGQHHLTLSEGCLIDKIEGHDKSLPLAAISKVTTLNDYTFIFTDEISAYIVPHKRVIEGDLLLFFNSIKDVLARSTEKTTK